LGRGVRKKGDEAVFEEVAGIRRRLPSPRELPSPLRRLDSDRGGEFINRILVHYRDDESIALTRARPYRKNDGCYSD
jgi:hypothetical protein